MSEWTVLLGSEVASWYLSLDSPQAARVEGAIDMLKMHGPTLGRPLVDSIQGSRHPNLKELRVGTVRILFAFDPSRQAILLVAGDKRKRWDSWYREAIPLADDRYDRWLEQR